MAKDTRASEELTAITEQAAKQAHDAVDAYFDFFKKAISSCPSGEMKLMKSSKATLSKTSPRCRNMSSDCAK